MRRYTQYTDSFQEWLLETALQRNVENARLIDEQAKKKKGKKTYKITTEEHERLVDAIVSSNQPLDNTSGLRDLQDAIPSRKEIAQYHKVQNTADSGQTFFNNILETTQAKIPGLIKLFHVALKAHDIEDAEPIIVVYHFGGGTPDASDNEDDAEPSARPEDYQQNSNVPTHPHTTPKKKSRIDNPLSEEEARLQPEFLVLAFLYELNRVRGIIREIWMSYRQGLITANIAAFVTDLAQSYIQQNIAALVEDLTSYASTVPITLSTTIKELYSGLTSSSRSPEGKSAIPNLSDKALRHLLCVDALYHIEEFLECHGSKGEVPNADPQETFLPFFKHFDAIRQDKVTVAIWDMST